MSQHKFCLRFFMQQQQQQQVLNFVRRTCARAQNVLFGARRQQQQQQKTRSEQPQGGGVEELLMPLTGCRVLASPARRETKEIQNAHKTARTHSAEAEDGIEYSCPSPPPPLRRHCQRMRSVCSAWWRLRLGEQLPQLTPQPLPPIDSSCCRRWTLLFVSGITADSPPPSMLLIPAPKHPRHPCTSSPSSLLSSS